MSTEPKWFTKFRLENDKRWEDQRKFNEDQRKFNNLLLSLPTIKKEIEELKAK